MQYATLSYLTLPDEYFVELSLKYQKRVTKLGDALAALGFTVIPPQGAYYLFVDYTSVPALVGMTSEEAAMHLLKVIGVACVPGDNFYGKKLDPTTKNKYLRFAACRSDDDLAESYRLQVEAMMTAESEKRIAEAHDPAELDRLARRLARVYHRAERKLCERLDAD